MMEEMKNAEPVLTLNPFEEMGKEPQAPAVPGGGGGSGCRREKRGGGF